jgi:peptidyl-prolyl cis-trans isomerase D
MLQAIRDKATGFFAWIIVVLLIIPFALWGIHEYFGGGSAVLVAKVNDTEISKNDLGRQVDLELRGQKKRPSGAEEVKFRQKVLDRMIREELLIQAAMSRGFQIHEGILAARIQRDTTFHKDGHFDQKYYEALLRNNGLTPKGYEYQVGRSMLIQQYLASILNSAFVTSTELNSMLSMQGRKIDISYFVLPRKKLVEGIKITDQQIRDYYDKNKAKFFTDEKVKLKYLLLDLDTIAKTIKFTEEQLQTYYESNKRLFTLKEQRKVAHILVELKQGATDKDIQTAQKKVEKIYAELKAGADFAALAKKYSDDAGSSGLGGSLGVVEPGTLDQSFDIAVASLKKGQFSQPVKTSLGFHIIKLEDVLPGKQKTFEQVREELVRMYRKEKAERIFADQAEKLYDLTYENPESLEVAARELSLPILESGWISRKDAGKGVLADPKVVAAAFSDEVLAGGDLSRAVNSKLIEVTTGPKTTLYPNVVVRVSDYKPSKQKPLDAVQEEIRNLLLQQAAREILNKKADELIARLNKGEKLDLIAKENNLKIQQTGLVTRGERKLDAKMLVAAYKTPVPYDGKPSYGSAVTMSRDLALFRVNKVQDGEVKPDDPARKFVSQIMRNMIGNAEVEALIESLRKKADITIFKERLNPDNDAL